MSFLEIAQEIKKSGFDARKDSANGGSEGLPVGTYNVMLKVGTFHIAESGWEYLRYNFEVQDGEFAGKEEIVSFGTLETWGGKNMKFIVERGIKFFQKAVVLSDDELLQSDFEDGHSLADALNRKAVGSFYTLEITEYTSKKRQTYRQYDLNEAEETVNTPAPDFGRDTDKDSGSPMEISDDDMPF